MSAEDYVKALANKKEHPDEFNIILSAKSLRSNLTVITSYKEWQLYDDKENVGYVVGYKGVIDNQGKWLSTAKLGESVGRSK